ncbi:hypothetical protein [uncultured Pontibacter sp.]|nr:hypothetical protein [uncultured Pontibacter sp.]
MANYIAKSTNSLSFYLTSDDEKIGELIYEKWYASNAEIKTSNGANFHLKPKGIWNSKIELKDGEKTILEFKLGWNGILIKTFFQDSEKSYSLRSKGFSSNKFILTDSEKKELLVAEMDTKLDNLNYKYSIRTTDEFESFRNKDISILALLHCINYYIYITTIVSVK